MNGLKLYFVLVEEADRGGCRLVGVIAPDLALAGARIVGLPDSGQQQQLDVEELEGTQQDEVGRLLPLLA